jgi:hypothetical protein
MDTIGLVAPRQWGKTTIIKYILQHIDKKRVFILDSNLEYRDFPNAIIPKYYSQSELDKFLIKCRQHYNILVIVEDLDLYISTYPSEEFKKLLINGNHQNIGLIYTAKRAVGIPKLILTETKHLLVGRFIIPNDINYLSGIFKNVDKVKQLNRYEFLYKNRDTGEESIFRLNI